jgi:hypothetical protein
MKPFNLEAALKGQKVVLRNGLTATVAAYNKDADTLHQIIGWTSDGYALSWSAKGQECREYDHNGDDIVGMAPIKRSR